VQTSRLRDIYCKAAQALGLTIPPHVLLQATEVIQ
jgi:hypothetical protein